MSSTSLAVTVAHAVAYITRPLLLRSSPETLLKLQLALETNLIAHYASSWVPSEPLRGSGRRCMTLSPTVNPPRPIYAACCAANVDWSDWIAALGGLEFDLFVDPGCVSVRFSHLGTGPFSKLVTVWSEELTQQNERAKRTPSLAVTNMPLSPAFVERLRAEDEEDEEELFAMLADELAEPTWKTPVFSQFPSAVTRSSLSRHSRSSSMSSGSDSSSGYSLFDDSDSMSSVTTASSVMTETSKLSRRERARLARVYVDASKTDVTPYDGGKTTVLTGGVMLGAPPKPVSNLSAKASAPTKQTPSPKSSAALPWTRQPLGPSSNCTWRVRA